MDYYGVASVLHVLLFGTALRVTWCDGVCQLAEPLRKYWQVPLWESLFTSLLNTRGTAPLASLRAALERHLSDTPSKAKSLSLALHKQEDRIVAARMAAL